jgi:hypothetical protein
VVHRLYKIHNSDLGHERCTSEPNQDTANEFHSHYVNRLLFFLRMGEGNSDGRVHVWDCSSENPISTENRFVPRRVHRAH